MEIAFQLNFELNLKFCHQLKKFFDDTDFVI